MIQRTLDKIEELKERPHDERRAIALYGALLVMGILLLGWGAMAIRGVASGEPVVAETGDPQTASAAAAFTGTDSTELPYASSTDGYVDLIPAE